MLTFLTERHICVYKRDIDNALGKYRKYMVGEPELMNGAINEFVNARFFIQAFLDLGEIMAVVYYDKLPSCRRRSRAVFNRRH